MEKQFTEWYPSGIRNIEGLFYSQKVKKNGGVWIAEHDNIYTLKF